MKTQYLFNNLLKNSKIYVMKYIKLLFRLTFIFERLIDKFICFNPASDKSRSDLEREKYVIEYPLLNSVFI